VLASLPDYLAQIATVQPGITEQAAYSATLETLTGQPLDTEALSANLFALSEAVPDAHLTIADLPPAVGAAFGGEAVSQLINSYLNSDGAARFEVVLNSAPYSQSAMDTVDELNTVFATHTDEYGVAGTTANNADLREILTEDSRMTIGLVLLGIFIVLLVMLRSIVAPMYLIGTILFSYTTTLGITRLVSDVVWGTSELTWWVPFFMFVFLVALGIDYSIFLFGRIKEEVGQHGINDGIHHAVQSTGSIITSAGVIVAGTFGAMMTGEILGLAQIGFAVAVGILIDTFVVRTVLDPALAALFGKWTWFPGGVPQQVKATDEADAVRGRGIPEMSGASD
jgi:RND superfamily putative drug exporter